MVTWWTLDGILPNTIFAAIVTTAVIELIYDSEWRYENAVALTTALAIFSAGRRGKLGTWLNWPWLQHIGRISYSLYLIHFPVCHLITTTGWELCGNRPSTAFARLIMLAAFTASLFAGHLLYKLVEAPSSRWAAKAKAA